MQSSFHCFFFSCNVFLDQSAHVRQPITIWPGNSKSQMKQQGGSYNLHITKSPVKARERSTAMGLSLIWCLQSWPMQEAVIPISCPHHTGDHSTTEVWWKITFFNSCIYSFSQGHECVVIVLTNVSPSSWKEIAMALESHL